MRLTVFGIAVPQGSKSAFVVKGRAVVTDGKKGPALKEWRTAIASEARTWLKEHGAPTPLDCPVGVMVTFYMPKPKSAGKRVKFPATKPDVDKLARAVNDALTGIAYTEDSRIVELTVRKKFAIDKPPRAEIFVYQVIEEAA